MRIVSLIVLLLTVLALNGCGQRGEDLPEVGIRPVKLIQVESAEDVRTLVLPAVIEAAASSDLSFQVGGFLMSVAVREGETVKRGSVVARLEPRDFKNSLAQAQAQFNQAEAEYERSKRLIATHSIARSVHVQRETDLRVAEATLDSAKKALDDSVLVAPFDGVVSRIVTDPDQNVTPRQAIVTLHSRGKEKAVVEMPATVAARSRQIAPINAFIELDALGGEKIPAAFLSTETQADPVTQTFKVSFMFQPPKDGLVLPGMSGTLHLKMKLALDGTTETIKVPLEAILSSGGVQYVWLVDTETMTVTKQPVVVDEWVGDAVRIASGIKPGDNIVGAGAAYLHEGMQIRRFEP